MKRVIIFMILIFLITPLFFSGCTSQQIRVSSYSDPEGMLMAQLIILSLKENGLPVIDAGPSTDASQAFRDKNIDIYANYYTSPDVAASEDIPKTGVVWLKPAPADSKWAIVITKKLSEAENITNMSAFAAYVNSKKGQIKLICSSDFVSSKTALPDFEQVYGFTLRSDQLVIVPTYNFRYMWTQAASMENDINAAMAYTTGGRPGDYNMVMLKDDKGAQPDFYPAPLVTKSIYDKYGDQLNRILTPLFASLNDEKLRELNSQDGVEGKEAISEVARQYLVENGYFKYDELQMVQEAMDDMMKNNNLSSVPSHLEPTSDMSVFPDKKYALYSKNMKWPYITWRITEGTYECNSNGIVTQVSTGW